MHQVMFNGFRYLTLVVGESDTAANPVLQVRNFLGYVYRRIALFPHIQVVGFGDPLFFEPW